jgi:hypothetical protein
MKKKINKNKKRNLKKALYKQLSLSWIKKIVLKIILTSIIL